MDEIKHFFKGSHFFLANFTVIQLCYIQIQQGEIVNVYIMALHALALEQEVKMPEFFSHPDFTSISYTPTIMTSQVPSEIGCVSIFATPVHDGYAVCYNPQPENVEVSVTSWKSCSNTCSRKMTQHIQQAIMDAKDLLCNQAP